MRLPCATLYLCGTVRWLFAAGARLALNWLSLALTSLHGSVFRTAQTIETLVGYSDNSTIPPFSESHTAYVYSPCPRRRVKRSESEAHFTFSMHMRISRITA